jgi:hypothetical protein
MAAMSIRNRGLSVAAALLAIGLGGGTAHAAGGKVDVCHREGNGTFHLINISASALSAHTRHGDKTPASYWADADGDGYGNPLGARAVCPVAGYVPNNTDCDDTRADVSPGATEVLYNGVDDDCNPATPDDDLDNDGYDGDEDCDDGNALVNPGMPETPYNGLDDDCNGGTPDDDLDGDGFPIADDCDDTSASTYPGALDVCGDGIDNSCDGTVDENCIAECPCFGPADLDEAYGAYLGNGGTDAGPTACWSESIAGAYDAAGIYFISSSFQGLTYAEDRSKFYSYGYDEFYGNEYCQKYDSHLSYDYGTGELDRSEVDDYRVITVAEREGCEQTILDWAAAAGLACATVAP